MPTNVTHSFDRTPPVYAPGEVIRLTVTVDVEDPAPVAGRVLTQTVVVLPNGMRSAPVVTEAEYVVDEGPGIATTEVASDSAGRVWTRGATQGNSTTFSAVA